MGNNTGAVTSEERKHAQAIQSVTESIKVAEA